MVTSVSHPPAVVTTQQNPHSEEAVFSSRHEEHSAQAHTEKASDFSKVQRDTATREVILAEDMKQLIGKSDKINEATRAKFEQNNNNGQDDQLRQQNTLGFIKALMRMNKKFKEFLKRLKALMGLKARMKRMKRIKRMKKGKSFREEIDE